MISVIFCGYRAWAISVFDSLLNHPKLNVIGYYKSNDEFLEAINKVDFPKIDIAIFVGWSWILDISITNRFLCLGIHPSDLPNYKGGSPIQNQIIDGIERSKVTLITLSQKLDGGHIWLKEDVSFEGDTVADIFNNLAVSCKSLLSRFFENFENMRPQEQDKGGSYFPRRKPNDSQITSEELEKLNVREIYNKIRCLTDPYPNAYIESKNGDRLYFEKVRFESGLSNAD